MTHEERQQIMLRNEERLGMPRTLGYIDGTLIRIKPPVKDMNRQGYYCRKGYTALNTQIVCDADLAILNVNASHPGSCNDRFIWNGTPVHFAVEEAYYEDRCWLLGDSGYALYPWLHIPILYAAPVACCVLHNYCIKRGLVNPRPYIENIPVEIPDFDDLPVDLRLRANAERQYLIDYCHARKLRRMQIYG
ncbi:Putative nuclease [Frankliniella fusca]|uniref:Nuclease n=1 Tax=Frankliniella fusca TaxID=407009 RepID=A0AAE1HGF6_9NEOP|nr:Putative nuclease [Frankliniella fusca]